METTKVRRIGKVREKRHKIIIVKGIDIKTFPRMERDCQMGVTILEISRDTCEKMDFNQEKLNTLRH